MQFVWLREWRKPLRFSFQRISACFVIDPRSRPLFFQKMVDLTARERWDKQWVFTNLRIVR